MGHLAEVIAELRLTQPANPQPPAPDAWREDALIEWLLAAPPDFAGQRSLMIEALDARLQPLEARLPAGAVARALTAMDQVPRERFICPWIEELAYLPMPIDIGLDQIISHPELAALLASAADPRGGSVLDVGTGSGYQAAVLARMAAHVTSVEILEPHAVQAARRLAALGFANVDVHVGDAADMDIFEAESFDAIVIAAGARSIPQNLLALLKVGGRMVMPLGESQDEEELTIVARISASETKLTPLIKTRFVPLTGSAGRSLGLAETRLQKA